MSSLLRKLPKTQCNGSKAEVRKFGQKFPFQIFYSQVKDTKERNLDNAQHLFEEDNVYKIFL